MPLQFERDGAELHTGLAANLVRDLQTFFSGEQHCPGKRITDLGDLRQLFGIAGPIGSAVAKRIGLSARPVRAIAFDKSDQANWGLGWHQDRTTSVSAKVETPGFSPWTIKQGAHHVQPPSDLLGRMATIRIHLDEVDHDNAPLKIAPGSHLFGKVAEEDIPSAVKQCGQAVCLADGGDVWFYASLILHASDRAVAGRRRRVLQIDYAAEELPGELTWLKL